LDRFLAISQKSRQAPTTISNIPLHNFRVAYALNRRKLNAKQTDVYFLHTSAIDNCFHLLIPPTDFFFSYHPAPSHAKRMANSRRASGESVQRYDLFSSLPFEWSKDSQLHARDILRQEGMCDARKRSYVVRIA
jgi:hypothetical protein